jgi:agmatinase
MIQQFLGYPPELINQSKAQTIIIPVPFENSVSYGRGAINGPHAILDASRQVEFYDCFLGKEYPMGGVFTQEEMPRHLSYDEIAVELSRRVGNVLDIGKFPLILGGEHSIAVPAVSAFAKKHPGGVLIHFDAHADLRESYQNNPNSHACALRRMRDLGLRSISAGIRSISPEESIYIRQESVEIFNPENDSFWDDLQSAISRLSGPAWLTFDVDGMDPSIMPATGTPEPGGLNWRETMRFLLILAKSNLQIKGVDIVEFAPIPQLHHADFTAAKLTYRMIMLFA